MAMVATVVGVAALPLGQIAQRLSTSGCNRIKKAVLF